MSDTPVTNDQNQTFTDSSSKDNRLGKSDNVQQQKIVGNVGGDVFSAKEIKIGQKNKIITNYITKEDNSFKINKFSVDEAKDIIELVDDIQRLLKNSDMVDDQRAKCDRYLKTLKDEAREKNPDKDYAARTLQKVVHVLKEAGQTTDSAVQLMERVQPVITRVIPWLGEAKKFLKL